LQAAGRKLREDFLDLINAPNKESSWGEFSYVGLWMLLATSSIVRRYLNVIPKFGSTHGLT